MTVVAATTCQEDGEELTRMPKFPPDVGTRKLLEDESSVIWDMVIPPGVRLPPHEHMYDYSFHVLEGSRLAVFSGDDAKHLFSFDSPLGATMAFKRREANMVDVTGAIPPFPAVHGVENVGNTTYREILVETKPCKGTTNAATALRYDTEPVRRIHVTMSTDFEASQKSVSGVKGATYLASSLSVNHENELEFTNGFTHATLFAFDDAATRNSVDVSTTEDSLTFDFHPLVVKDAGPAPEGMNRVKHMVLIKWQSDAPVGQLVAGYIGLTGKISEMKGFEWGPVANKLGMEPEAKGYEYGFITTFDNEEGRTAYLDHDAHQEYLELILPHMEDFLVMDILEA